MDNEFIPYEQALELKELGFDEECLASYICHKEVRFDIQEQSGIRWHSVKNSEFEGGEHCTAPLYQQAFRWFRKNKLRFSITARAFEKDYLYKVNILNFQGCNDDYEYLTYEEAEAVCLKMLIGIKKINYETM